MKHHLSKKVRLIGILVAFLMLWLLWRVVSADISTDWNITFEDLEIGELVGQSDFYGETGFFSVSSEQTFEGSKSGKGSKFPGTQEITFDPDNITIGDIAETYLLHYRGTTSEEAGPGFHSQFLGTTGEDIKFAFYSYGGEEGYRLGLIGGLINFVNCETGAWIGQSNQVWIINPGTLPRQEWVEIKIIIYDNHSFRVGWSAPGVEYEETPDCFWWNNIGSNFTLDKIVFLTSRTFYFDEIKKITPPPNLEIQGYSPGSGTEVNDLNQNIIIKYFDFDWEIYNGFVVNFRDNKIWAVGNSQQYLAEDLDPDGTGQVSINLQSFQFDSNGNWYLTGLGFGTHLDIEGGMFLTTRGYVDFWTDDLVQTPYYLFINVEGLFTPYTFTDPEDWYAANVERFETSTTLFSAFTGLLAPLFEKVGEFGTRVQGMFDKEEAYDRGYGLGEIFPLIQGYIQKIDQFFGGFPLATFFKYLILVMLAIFIVRAVMKFIPFFG